MTTYKNLSEDDLKKIVQESHSWLDVITKCGLKTITRSLQRRITKYGIDCSHFEKYFDGKYTKVNKFTKEHITEVVKNNDKWIDIMKAFGYISCAHVEHIQTKLTILGIDFNHVDQDYEKPKNFHSTPLSDILVAESTYTNMTSLRSRLKKELGWEHKCVMCNNTEWNKQPIPLQIDHINGNHFDNRIENLRFLCPNCHAQTDTYCGKNTQVCKDNKLKNEDRKNTPSVKEIKQKNICVDCSKEVKSNSTRCKDCDEKQRINRRKVVRPSYEQLKLELQQMSMVKVGKKYGVSDNCIRKWVRQYAKNAI